MSNGSSYPIGSSANQSQLGTMVGVGIPASYTGDFSGSIDSLSVGPSDYAINQAYGTGVQYTPYAGSVANLDRSLTANAVIDNSVGGTPAYLPPAQPLTGGVPATGLVQLNPQANPTTSGSASTGSGSGSSNVQVGAQPALLTWLQGAGAYFSNWVTRGFLIIIGLVIVAIGIVHVMSPGAITKALKG